MEDYIFSITTGSTGLSILLIAFIIDKFQPKKINKIYGYRTKASMKSQERWDFAQHYSTQWLKFSGAILILLAAGFYFVPMSETPAIISSMICIMVMIFIPIIKTESALKENFDD